MEHILSSLLSKSFSVPARDPYGLSHRLLHWCQQFGRVEESMNRIAASGPRVESNVRFVIKKSLDNYSSLNISVRLDGHVNRQVLDAVIEASFRSSVPAALGVVSGAFEEYYRARIFPLLSRAAKKAAAEITDSIERRLVAEAIQKAAA